MLKVTPNYNIGAIPAGSPWAVGGDVAAELNWPPADRWSGGQEECTHCVSSGDTRSERTGFGLWGRWDQEVTPIRAVKISWLHKCSLWCRTESLHYAWNSDAKLNEMCLPFFSPFFFFAELLLWIHFHRHTGALLFAFPVCTRSCMVRWPGGGTCCLLCYECTCCRIY